MRRLATTILLAAVLAFGGAVSAEPESTRGWHYTVSVSPDMERLDVRVCFRHFVPRRLVLGRSDALDAFTVRPRPDGRPGYAPNPGRDGVRPILDDEGCVRYRVDLRALAGRAQTAIDTKRVGRDLVTRPSLCLLMPAVWPDDADVTLTFVLPRGMRAAVAWERSRVEGRTVYRLPKTACLPQTRMAFGRFEPLMLDVGGATLEVIVLDQPHRLSRAGVETWIRGCAVAVARLFDGFPVPRACLMVYPRAPGRKRPVTFGRAMRAGGAFVDLVISPASPDAPFIGEWMTVHELTHLGLPWHDDPSRWWGEGFVAYYQDVLRARMGWVSEQAAWQRMESWMDRGRSSGGRGTLAADSAQMTASHAYHRVYYGGAAIAFLIDVELRRRSNGTRSLDDVMRILSRDLRVDGKSWNAAQLMREVDRRLGERVCAPIASRWLGSRGFPDVRPAQRELGIRVTGGRVTLDDRAPRAADRRAIMRFDAPPR